MNKEIFTAISVSIFAINWDITRISERWNISPEVFSSAIKWFNGLLGDVSSGLLVQESRGYVLTKYHISAKENLLRLCNC